MSTANQSIESRYKVRIYNTAGNRVQLMEMSPIEFVSFEQRHLMDDLDYEYERVPVLTS